MFKVKSISYISIFIQFFIVSCRSQTPGCTDPLANNYDPGANVNDGSCTYDPISVSPRNTYLLNDLLQENSGLLIWDGNIWTQIDNRDLNLYGLDLSNGAIRRTYSLKDVENIDWEEITQDEEFIYVGDFGNNTSGNRTDLHILRVKKSSLLSGNQEIDTIWFTYSDQMDLNPAEANKTDFDCEAFIVSKDSIYLFTKQWISAGTSVYGIPKIPGNYNAKKVFTHSVEGLVTGAAFLESKHLIVLCGYTSLLHPFLYLLYDFQGMDFFSGNKRRITVSLPFHQVEGIATADGINYYISNENFVYQPIANSPQKLHSLDLKDLLDGYLSQSGTEDSGSADQVRLHIYPNPSRARIFISAGSQLLPGHYQIYNQLGEIVLYGALAGEMTEIDITSLSEGTYILRAGGDTGQAARILKL